MVGAGSLQTNQRAVAPLRAAALLFIGPAGAAPLTSGGARLSQAGPGCWRGPRVRAMMVAVENGPPRHPKGSSAGGRFAPRQTADPSGPSRTMRLGGGGEEVSDGLMFLVRYDDDRVRLALAQAVGALDKGRPLADISRRLSSCRPDGVRRAVMVACREAGIGDGDFGQWWAEASEIEARIVLADALALAAPRR